MEENKASKMFLVVAVVLGVMATVLAFTYINSNATPADMRPVTIVVAKHDLRAYTPLDPARDFSLIEVPRKYAAFANLIIAPDQKNNYRGEKLDRPVAASEPIFLFYFSPGDLPPPEEPYRYKTIPANPGLIICGDYVKVSNSNGIMLGGGPFRVVAVGGIPKKYRNAPTIRLEDVNRTLPKTITLEVTEAQASELDKGMSTSPDKNFLIICPPPKAETRP